MNFLVTLCNIVLLAIIIVCTFIRIYSLSNWKLILHFPHIQALGNHHSMLFLLNLTSLLLLLLLFLISHKSEAIYYMSLSLWLILPSIVPSRPIHVVTMAGFPPFLWLTHMCCLCVLKLFYTFPYRWTLGWFLYLSYCGSCLNEHGDAYIFELAFSFSSDKDPKGEWLDHTVALLLVFRCCCCCC